MGPISEGQPSVSEVARDVALQNPIVLNEIFMHLPSNFLVLSCSLVNKTWYRITRTVLRDHGKCLANISSLHAYQDILALEQFCQYLEREGRVVPFNGLRIYNCVPFHPEWHPIDLQSLAVYCKSTQLIKLKHLKVGQAEIIARLCPLQYTMIAWILSGQGSQLESLHVENPVFLAELFHPETPVELAQLIAITIPELPFEGAEDCVKCMLAAASNLKRIAVQDRDMLEYLPPDKHSLLVAMHFHVKTAEQEQLFGKILDAEPKLAELLYVPPSHAMYDWEHSDDEDSVDPAAQQRSDNMLERLLKTCHGTLESMRVIGLLNPLGGLSFPPLVNLTKIKMEKWLGVRTGIEKFWRDIAAIDYRRRMPALEEIVIIDKARQLLPDGSLEFDMTNYEKKIEWPTSVTGPQIPPECSSNARKLTLHVDNKNINLIPIKSMAPNVTLLQLKIRHDSEFNVDIAPFSHIWRFWPQLEQLTVDIGASLPNRSYDADFCGIHEEEAEVLRDKDENYLRNLHIVPVRPSVLTMTKLQKMAFELDFWDWNDYTDGPPTFLSHVTQILAFRRMQDMVIEIWKLWTQLVELKVDLKDLTEISRRV